MTRSVLLSLGVFTLAISSCCTKKKCINPGIEFIFHDHSFADVDTIYDIRDGDTSLVSASSNMRNDDTSYYYRAAPSEEKYAGTIQIWIPATQKSYILTDFTYRKENCNDCFPPGI